MSISFATPIGHQTGGNYAAFNNAVTVGRPFRQPLTTAPNPNNFSEGLELFLSNAGDVANIYSWLDCILTWEAATPANPGNRLVLETEPQVLNAPGAGRALASLPTLEARPKKAIYENVNQADVQTALESLLTDAHATAAANPGAPNTWHPSMRMRVTGGGATVTLKAYIDNHPPTAATITGLVTDLLAGAAGAVLTKVRVKAGDRVGRAAGYLAGDTLPAAPPFPLGDAGDADRARRLTFRVIDLGKQALNPVYYLHIYMHQALVPAANRIVNALTNIVNAGALRHPLVDLFPALIAAQPPSAREQVGGQHKFAIGELNDMHGHPKDGPTSTLEWRYSNTGEFEAQGRVAGTAVPALAATAGATNKVNNLWNPAGPAPGFGSDIGNICTALQVPVELVAALVGSEALPNLDPRATRLEPLRQSERAQLSGAGVGAAVELAYDKTVGIEGNATSVAHNANDTSRLTVTLTANRTWAADVLRRRAWSLLVGDVDRLSIRGNTAGAGTVNYDITVRDRQLKGGSAAGGTQNFGTTLFYSPASRGAGQGAAAGTAHGLGRSGTLRRFRLTASQNTLDGNTVATVFHNGAPTGITVTLAAGALVGNDNAHTVAVNNGDNISVQVTTAGTTGSIRNLRTELLHAPDTGDVWVMEGFSTSVPNPWNGGAVVRAGRALTWDQLVTVVDATNGSRISPGLLQTLISTARGVLPFLNNVAPTIFATLGIPAAPATAGQFLNDWLLEGSHSLLLGIAYMRKAYNVKGTAFDLPLVGAAYNAGSLRRRDHSLWGLQYFGDYVEHAAPHYNAAVALFNGAPVPAPTVRFMR